MPSIDPTSAAIADILDRVQDGVFVLDAESRFTFINQAAEEILGRGRAALLGQSPWDAFPSAVGSRSQVEYQRALTEQVAVAFEDFSERLGRWFDVRAVPADGRLVVSFRDITARRAADERLRRSEARFVSLMKATQQAVWVTEPDGTVREDNPEWRAFTGLRREETKGMGWLTAVHPDEREAMRAAWMASVAAGTVFEGNQRLLRHDGVYRRMRVCGIPIRDAAGTVTEWVGTSTDVTEQLLAEQEQRERGWLLAEAMRMAQVGSGAIDLDTNTVRLSDEELRILGVPRGAEPATFTDFLELIHPEDRDLLAQAVAGVAQEKLPKLALTCRIVRPGGEVRLVQASAELHFEDGRPSRLIGAMQDITERERVAAAQRELELKIVKTQKMESLGILAGGIAHDVNNLLVGILGNASVAASEAEPRTPLADALGEILTTARRAAELAHQLLAYSGKGRFAVAPIDVSALMRETQILLRTVISRDATLRVEAPPDLPCVEADGTQLRQVVMNLITNASDALGAEPGTLTLTCGVVHATPAMLRSTYIDDQLPEGDYVTIEVADTGVGMTKDILAKMFDPFFTTKRSGHGLGLAATLGIVRGHRGAIQVESEPGKGTRVTVLLPAVKERSLPASPRAGGEGEAPRSSATILVVDDDAMVRRVAARMLARAGFTVMQAEHGKAALAVFEEHRGEIALVLLDLSMPVMGGEEAFSALRALDPGLPIVLSSGYSEQDATSHFVGRGLAGFVQKPFVMDDLIATVRQTLKG